MSHLELHDCPSDRVRPQALSGIRVLEVGHLIGGPFCAHLMADHGADVIKIEPPGVGDPMRQWGSTHQGVGLYWSVIARGKRSVTLDLRDPRCQEMFRELAKTADVVVENLRPGTMERWGLGWEQISRANTRLIFVRVSGFGQTGPYRDRAGFGVVAEAMSGFRYLTGEPGRPPVRVGISIADALAGTQGLIGALLALWHRDGPNGSGRGQVVDVALYEAMWMYMESLLADYSILGLERQPTGATLPGIAPSNVYPTATGEWIIIAANQNTVFTRLARAMGRNDWLSADSPFATHLGRGRLQAELDSDIAEWTIQRNAGDVLDLMVEYGVPAGRIYTAKDIANDPHYAAREMIVSVPESNLGGEEVPMPGVVPKLTRSPGRVLGGAPLLGEHTEEVLRDVVDPDRLRHLQEAGLV